MMTDSKSDEPEDLIEPLPGNNVYFKITASSLVNYHAYKSGAYSNI